LDFAAVYATLNAKKHPIYEAALEDCRGNEIETVKYLNDIKRNAATFICKHDNVWDRKELIDSLNEVQQNTEGDFVCLLGGKNTGKSLLINHVAKMTNSTIVIDLRTNPDILENLIKALKERGWINVVNGAIKVFNSFIKDISSIEIPALEVSLERLIDDIIAVHGNVTLYVDEANRAFTIDPNSANKKLDVDKALGSLELLTRLTKQEKRVLILQ